MTPEMEHALDQLELIESMGVYIPAKSRNAILTAILSGSHDSCSAGGIMIEVGDMELADTIAEEEAQGLKPIFGL